MAVSLVDILLAVVGCIILKRLVSRKPVPYPPGPKGWPIIGNIFDMPSEYKWAAASEWADKWGEVTYLNLLGQHFVFLSSAKAVNTLFEARSAIYSDRPYFTMGCELVGWNWTLALHPFGESHRAGRKLFRWYMGTKSATEKLHPIVEEETHKTLRRILDKPDALSDAVRKDAGGIILRVTYSYEPKEVNDPLVDLAEESMSHFALITSPNAFLVDTLPILKYLPAWFPGAGFKKTAAWMNKCSRDTVEIPLAWVRQQMAEGTAKPSFASRCLEDAGPNMTPTQERDIKWASASMYAAGADTTVAMMQNYFLAITLFTEAQKKAQEEIDRVIGPDRLPTLADRPYLPYVEALLKEAFRWHTAVPLDLAHRVTQDDIYEGYLIPKGSMVIANIWKLLHDPDTYADPESFRPERFLGENPERDPRDFAFGFGRRRCPGMNLADVSGWSVVAMSLAVFDISKAVDENGNVIEPIVDFTSETISVAKPFQYSIKPRSRAAEALILANSENL
ncbi:cytochrome P450 [Neolentinus lepideus HHB14362 ss-1]|uniref:Cytochrome P450 n=1 Tax=Neolentinus lepideus HHB14362 ss-1 TaxID=1314782 RepID=A0A165UUY6_9AGAM|nr:cytochrome P450 [Neolentinus lepideus HHB14362 ss-1]